MPVRMGKTGSILRHNRYHKLPGPPEKPGWYWTRRNVTKNAQGLDGYDAGWYIVEIRIYAGKLALMNTTFDGVWEHKYEWAGPIAGVIE